MPRAAPRNSRRGITVGVKLLVSLDGGPGGQGGNDAGLRGYDENSSSLVDHFNFQDKGGSGLGHLEEKTAVLLGKWVSLSLVRLMLVMDRDLNLGKRLLVIQRNIREKGRDAVELSRWLFTFNPAWMWKSSAMEAVSVVLWGG
ncbi:hypothetical protein RHGRI_029865 [Rhododendron griersonianum]|uniref:Uncharacterized protein n=1 Tax=Rhododendron griersonianum TaxID=479676 RepID=A0AAV6IKS9_9ERIC|nr:hypothetical protein RHGRI_029865 [Rhododendron griersonianum]